VVRCALQTQDHLIHAGCLSSQTAMECTTEGVIDASFEDPFRRADRVAIQPGGYAMECTVKDVSFYYEEIGAGRPIIMLHGSPLDHRSIRRDMEPLFAERSGWRRIYPDLPGMGKTKGADWITNHDQVLDLLIGFIDALAPGQRFVVVGHSYGGRLARGLVHHRGGLIDGLFLHVPVTDPVGRDRKLPKHRVLREDEEYLAALRPDEQNQRTFVVMQSMQLLLRFREFLDPAVKEADQGFLDRLRGANSSFSFDVDSLAQPFPAPALILTGRFDNWCGYQDAYALLDNYPRATFAVLDCAGHALSVEQPALFGTLVGDWLDRVEAYAPV
jgi:pimeloyl-ACP methyl ester carboxylesterase